LTIILFKNNLYFSSVKSRLHCIKKWNLWRKEANSIFHSLFARSPTWLEERWKKKTKKKKFFFLLQLSFLLTVKVLNFCPPFFASLVWLLVCADGAGGASGYRSKVQRESLKLWHFFITFYSRLLWFLKLPSKGENNKFKTLIWLLIWIIIQRDNIFLKN